MGKCKAETIRRLRFGNLVRLGQDRYGYVLPDDDAGREHLHDLLCIASLAATDPAKRMANVIENFAEQIIGADELEAITGIVNRTPFQERWHIAKTLGERHRVTNAEREQLKLWNISPCDMSAEDLAEQRKAKDRARKKLYRQKLREKQGKSSRAECLANSLSKTKPWVAANVSRATWYRRLARTKQKRAA
jgi:hypothetical protein